MDRRIRVLSLTGGLGYGGDENRLLTMAKHLDPANFEHCLVTFYGDDQTFDRQCGRMAEEFLDAGVTLKSLRLRRSAERRTAGKLGTGVTALSRLVKIIRETRCHVIDAHLFGANVLGILAGTVTGTPVAVTYYDRLDQFPALRRSAMRWTLQKAAAVITDSQFVVIPNGVAPPKPKLSQAEVRARLGVPAATGPIVAQIGRLETFKGHRVLLDAAHAALRQRPDLFFLAIGFPGLDDRYPESLHKRARDLGVADRVRIVGYQGVVGDMWSIVDVHAHASLYDSLPNAIIEGMSLGKPLVATAVGGIPEMVEHEQTGLIVPPNDAAALAAAILRVVDDPALARSLGHAAQERYQQRCEPRAFAGTLERLFADLAGPRCGPVEEDSPTNSSAAAEVCHGNR